MEDRRWSLGIHEAIENKRKSRNWIRWNKNKKCITYQNFFTRYILNLAGMTGTAKTTEKEFQEIYNLEVVVYQQQNQLIRK